MKKILFLSIALILVAGIVSLAKSADIDTNVSISTPTGYAKDRHIVKAAEGGGGSDTLIVLYQGGTSPAGIRARKSTNNGATWVNLNGSPGSTQVDPSTTTAFSICLSTWSGKIYMTYEKYNDIYFRKISYTGSGNWTVGGPLSVDDEGDNANPSIICTPGEDGDTWVAYAHDTGGSGAVVRAAYVANYYDFDYAVAITTVTSPAGSLNQYFPALALYNYLGDIFPMVIYQANTGGGGEPQLNYSGWGGGNWSEPTPTTISNTEPAGLGDFSLTYYESSNVIYLAYRHESAGIKYTEYNGSTWSSPVPLSTGGDAQYDRNPSLIDLETEELWCFASIYYAPDQYNIKYRRQSESTWGSWTAITTDNANNLYSTTPLSFTAYIPLAWTYGTEDPYTVKFDSSIISANRYWMGTGYWNDTDNWSYTSGGTGGASVPGAGNTAIFDSGSNTGSCQIYESATVASVILSSGYTDYIDIASDQSLTVSGSFEIGGGNFSAGSELLDVYSYSQTGGVFNAGASTVTCSSNFFTITGGTFNEGTSTLILSGSPVQILTSGGESFYDLKLAGSGMTAIDDDLNIIHDLTCIPPHAAHFDADDNNVTIGNNFQFDTGTLYLGDGSTWTVAGSWDTSSAGALDYETSTVDLTGSGNLKIGPGDSFYNLKAAKTDKTTTFQSNVGVANVLTLGDGTFFGSAIYGLVLSKNEGTPFVTDGAGITLYKFIYFPGGSGGTVTVTGGNYGHLEDSLQLLSNGSNVTFNLGGDITATNGSFSLLAKSGEDSTVNTQNYNITVPNGYGLLFGAESIYTGSTTFNCGSSTITIDTGGLAVANNGGSHTLNLSSATITCAGDWELVDGSGSIAQNPGISSVTFVNASSTSTLTGSTTFYGLVSTASGKTVKFSSDTVTGVTGHLNFENIILRSTLPGATWYLNLNPSATQDVSGVNVQDSNASGGETIVAASSTNAGNNINWKFGSRYWVGVSNPDNWNDANNWSSESGGAGGAGVPIPGYFAIFDGGNTNSCQIDISSTVASVIIYSTYTATVSIDSGKSLTTSGSFEIGGGTFTINGDLLDVGSYSQTGGIFNAGASSVDVGSYSQTGGIFNANTSSVTCSGNFTITVGTFNAGSTLLTIGGNWSVAGAATFNSQTSTVTFNGSGSFNILSSGTTFYSLVFNNSVSTWTLTDALYAAGDFTLTDSGNVDSNGKDITIAEDFTINSGKFTAGSSTITVSGNWDSSGGTFSYWPSTVVLTSTGTLSTSGSVNFHNLKAAAANKTTTLQNTVGVFNTLTLGTGTLTDGVNDYTMILWANAGTPLVNAGATITLDRFRYRPVGGGGAVTIAGGDYGTVNYLELWSVFHSRIFNLGGDITVDGVFYLRVASGFNNTVCNTQDYDIIATGLLFGDSSNTGETTFNCGISTMTIGTGGLAVGNNGGGNHTLNLSSATVTVAGDWKLVDGSGSIAQNPGISSVTFDNASSTSTLTGSTTFYGLVSIASGKLLKFSSGNLTGVTGHLNFENITLRSTLEGATWYLNLTPSATQDVSIVDVQDSNASGGETIIATNSTNSGNNTNWDFGLAYIVWDGGAVGDNNWSNGVNWVGDVVPGETDDVLFNDTSNKPCTIDISTTVASFSVQAGSTITITANENLTVTGNLSLSTGTFNAGSTLLTIGGNWSVAGDATFNCETSTVTFNGSSAQSITSAGNSFYDIELAGSGAVTINDDLSVNNNFTNTSHTGSFDADANIVTIGNDFQFDSGTLYLGTGSTWTVAGSWDMSSVGTLDYETSTVVLTGTGTLTTPGTIFVPYFYNLKAAAAEKTTTLQSHLGVANTLTLSTGTLTDGAGSYVMTLTKNGGTPFVNPEPGATITLNAFIYAPGSGIVTVAGGDYGTVNYLELSAVGSDVTFNLDDDITVNGTFLFGAQSATTNTVCNTQDNNITASGLLIGDSIANSSTTFNCGISTITIGTGGLDMANNGGSHTLNLSSATITCAGNWRLVNGSGSITQNPGISSVTLDGPSASTQTITSNGQSFYDIELASSSAVTINDDLSVNNNFTNTTHTGSFDAGNYYVDIGNDFQFDSGTLYLGTGSTWTVAGSWDMSSVDTLDYETSTVVLTSTGTLTTPGTVDTPYFYNLKAAAAGKTTTLQSSVGVDNILTLGTGTLTQSGGSYYMTLTKNGGTPFVNSGATITLLEFVYRPGSGTVTVTGGNYGTLWALRLRPTGSNVTFNLGGDITVDGAFGLDADTGLTNTVCNTQDNNITINRFLIGNNFADGSTIFNCGISTITIGTGGLDMDNNGGSHTLNLSSATITCAGDWQLMEGSGSITQNPGISSVTLDGPSAQAITSNGQSFYDIELASSSAVTIADDLSVTNNFTNTSHTGSFDAGANIVTIGNDFQFDSGTLYLGTGSTWTVAGSWDMSSVDTLDYETSTVVLTGTGTLTTPGTLWTAYFYNLKAAAAEKTTTLLDDVGVADTLTLGTGTLTGGAYYVTLTKNGGTPFVNSGAAITLTGFVYRPGSGIVTVTGGNYGTSDLWLWPSGSTVTFNLGGNITVGGYFWLRADSSVTGTVCNTQDNDITANELRFGDPIFDGPTTLNCGSSTIDIGTVGLFMSGNGGSHILNLSTATITCAGNWKLVNGSGSITQNPGISQVTLNGSSGTQDVTSNNQSFYNLIINNTGTSVQLQDAMDIDGDLTIQTGTLDLDGKDLTHTAGKTFSNDGILKLQGGETLTDLTNDIDSGTVFYVGDGDSLADTFTLKDFNTTDYYHLTINATDGTLDTFRSSTTALAVAGNFFSGSGTFTTDDGTNDQDLSVTGKVDINGTFNANSSTITVSGDWDSSAGTFNYDTSTVDLTDTGYLDTPGNVYTAYFYNLKAAAAEKTTTLWNSVGVANTLTLSTGTLTQLGGSYYVTLRKNGGTPLVNSGATITVLALVYKPTSGTVTVTGGNYEMPRLVLYPNASDATFNLGDDITLSGNFWLEANNGSANTVFNTQDNNITTGSLLFGQTGINGPTTFNCGSSTIDIGTSGLTVLSNGGSHTLNLSSATITCAGIWKLVDGSGSITQNPGISSVTLDDSIGTQDVTSNGQSFYDLTINNTGTSVRLEDDLDVDGDLTITQGTLDTKSGENNAINVAGNWAFEGGTFTVNSSTVTFDNASSTSTLTGSTTFYGLVSTASGKLVKFSSNTTTYATGYLNFENITLRSTLDNATWYLNLSGSGTQDVSSVNVQDSNASGGSTIYAVGASTDSGNNTNWAFSGAGLTLTWTGVVNSTFSVAGNWDPQLSPTPTSNIIIPNTTTKPKLEANTSINGLNISEGEARLELNSYNLTISSYVTLAGTMTCTGTEQITAGGGWDATGGYFDAANSTTTFNGSGSFNILSSGTTFYNLVFNNSVSTWTLTDALYAAGDFTLTDSGNVDSNGKDITIAEDVTINSGKFTAGSSTITVSGNWDSSGGTFNYGTSTVVLTSTGTLTTPGPWDTPDFYNLKAAAAGKTTTLQSDVAVDNILTLGTGTLTDGAVFYIMTLTKNGGTPLVNSGATITIWLIIYRPASGIVTVAGGNYGTSDLWLYPSGSDVTFNLGGDITVDGGFWLRADNSLTNTVCNTQDNNITADRLEFGLITVDGPTTFNCKTSTITIGTGGFYVANDGGSHTVNLGTATITCAGQWKLVDGSGSIAQNPGNSSVTLNGTSGTQEVTSNGQSFYNLTINNTGTSVQLQDAMDIDGDLTIQTGTLDLDGNNLTHTAGKTFSNNDTLQLWGEETLTDLTNDIDSGTVLYVGDGDSLTDTFTLKEFNTTDYYHLTIDATDGTMDTFRSSTTALAVAGNFFLSTGTFTTNDGTTDQDLSVTGNVDIDDTFNANSSTITVNGNWDHSGGTLTYSTSTIVLTGASPSFTTGGLSKPIYNLTCTTAGQTVTLSNSVGMYGVLTVGSVSGDKVTITSSSIYFYKETTAPIVFNRTHDVGYNITGFSSAFRPSNTGVIPAGTYGYLSAMPEGAYTLTMQGAVTATGDLDIYDNTMAGLATLDTGGYALTVNGVLYVGVPAPPQGKLVAHDSSIVVTGNVYINTDAVGDSIIDADTSSWEVGGIWYNNGTFTADSSTIEFKGASGTQDIYSGGNNFYNVTINNTGTSVEIEEDLDVDGDLTITQGTLDTKSGENNPINVAGNWAFEGGTFTVNSSTVTFDNASSTSTLTGSTTFYGLVSTASGKLVKFSSDTITGVTGHLNFENITLRSTLDNATWYLNLSGSGTQDVSSVNVQDSNASGGSTIYAVGASTDSGNNTNWAFSGVGLTLTWTGVVNSTFSVAGNWNPQFSPTATSNIIIPNTVTKPKLEANTSINGLNISEGEARLELNSYNLTISSYVTLAGTMTCAGTEQITAGGGWTATGGYFDAAQSTVTFNGSGSFNILSSGTTFYSLVFNNSVSTWTLTDALYAAGDFTLTDSGDVDSDGKDITIAGDVTINGGKFTAGSSTITVSGNWDSSAGTFNYETSTVVLTSTGTLTTPGSQYIPYFYNLKAAAAEKTTTLLDDVGVADTLTLGTGTLTGAAYYMTLTKNGGTPFVNSGATITLYAFVYRPGSGTVTVTGGNYGTSDYLMLRAEGSDVTFNLGGDITVDGTFWLNALDSATNMVFNTQDNKINATGALFFGAGSSYDGPTTFNCGTSTITIGGLLVAPDSGSHTLNLSSATVTCSGAGWQLSWGTGSITQIPGISSVTLNGSSGIQTVTSNSQSFYNLIINNTGTSVRLDDAMDIDGDLTIQTGILYLNGKDLTHTAGKTFYNNDTLQLQGGETLTDLTNDIDSGTVLYVGDGDSLTDTFTLKEFNTTDYYHLTIDATDGTMDTFRSSTTALAVAGNFFLSTGTFTTNDGTTDQDLSVTGNVDIDDTFNANSSTITVNGNWDHSGGTFIYDTSTIVLTGDSPSFTGGTATTKRIYNLTCTTAGQTVTLSNNVGMYGVLTVGSASGDKVTITSSSIYFYKDTTAPIAFNREHNVGYNITGSSSAFNPSYTGVIPAGTYGTLYAIPQGTYTLTMQGAVTTMGNLDIYDNTVAGLGTLDTGGYALTVNGVLSVGVPGPPQGKLVAHDSSIIVTGNVYIYTSGAVGDSIIDADTSSWEVGGIWYNNGTFTADSSTIEFKGTSGTQDIVSGGSNFYNVIINNTGTSVELEDDLDVDGDLTITQGTLDTKSGENNPINVAGDWAFEGGTFTVNSSTVTFDNASSTSTLTGSTTFYGLVSTASGKLVKFSSDTVTGVTGHLNFENITLRSTLDNATWYLNLSGSGTQDVSSVNVQDSNASGGSTIYAVGASTDSGNNTNWAFSGAGLTLTWTGVVNSTFSVAGNWDPQLSPTPTSNIIIPNKPTKPKLEANTSINGLNISEGEARLELNSYNLTISSYVTLAGTMTCAGTEQITAGGGWTATGGYFDAAQSTVTFNGSGSFNILSSGTTFYNLAFSNSVSTWTLTDALYAAGDFTITNSSGNVTSNDKNLTIAGDFTINSGKFTAGVSTITVSGNWDSSGGTFNYDTSTVVLTSTGTLNIKIDEYFYNLKAAAAGKTTTLQSHVGVANTLTLGTGTLTGAAYYVMLTKDGGTPFVNSGATITLNSLIYRPFSGIVTVTGGNYGTLGTYLWLYPSGSDVTFNLGGNITIDGAFRLATGDTINGTVCNTQDNDITADGLQFGSVAIDGPITLNCGTSTIDIGTDGLYVGVNGGNHTLNLSSATITCAGAWWLASGSGSITQNPGISLVTLDGSGGTQTVISNSQSFYNLTIDNNGAIAELEDDLDVDGDLTITQGTLDTYSFENNPINVAGDWTYEGGAFECRQSTVTFDNASSTSTLTGSTTFYGLVSTASGKLVKFSSDTVTGVTGYLNFENITLRSTLEGATWYLNLSGNQDVSSVNVQDSNASGSTIVALNSTDFGNNTNWDFGPPGAITDLTGLCNSGTGDVTLSWSTPGDDGWTGTLPSGSKYRIDYSSYSIAWSTENYKVDIPTHSVAPYTEVSHTLTGLTGDSTWYFRIWTQDEVFLWSGLSNGATVWVNPIISVSISTDTYNFGNIECATSTVSGSIITVTNGGNVTETYSIKCSSTTKWTPQNTPGQNEFTLQSAFHPSEPANNDLIWETDDILTESLQTCTTAAFSIDGTEHGKEVQPFDTNDRKLWFRLKMPLSTSTTDQQTINITISAEQSP